MIKKEIYSEYVKPLLDALDELRKHQTKKQDLTGADKVAEAAAWISNNWYENFDFRALDRTRKHLGGNMTADDILADAFSWEHSGHEEDFWSDIFDALFVLRMETTPTPTAHSPLSESTLSDAIADLKTNAEPLTIDASNIDAHLIPSKSVIFYDPKAPDQVTYSEAQDSNSGTVGAKLGQLWDKDAIKRDPAKLNITHLKALYSAVVTKEKERSGPRNGAYMLNAVAADLKPICIMFHKIIENDFDDFDTAFDYLCALLMRNKKRG
jgi:hypothetical protein